MSKTPVFSTASSLLSSFLGIGYASNDKLSSKIVLKLDYIIINLNTQFTINSIN